MTNPILINGRPMRIAIGGNSPLTPGGYGQQTRLLMSRFRDRLGIDVAVSASYGHLNGKLIVDGIDVYPHAYRGWGNDIHAANAQQHRADLLLTHQDVPWQDPRQLTARGMRWATWFPIDHTPLAPSIVARLDPDYCYQPIALSHFGTAVARAAGLDIRTVIQGIDTNVFIPGDRAEARATLGWPQDAFIVGIIAQNRGYPDRKAYPQQIRAFRAFAQKHSDAMVYIHAFANDVLDPEARTDIPGHLGDMAARALYAHPYDLNMGYKVADMVTRYQAMDVLLGVSMAEGFGLPLIEAQSTGCPVITGNWTAMPENCYAGWIVGQKESIPWYVEPYGPDCEWRLPHTGAIEDRLEQAYTVLQGNAERLRLSIVARAAIVHNHDQDMLIDTQWRPVLQDIAARIEQERVPWHVHRWAGWGHQSEGGIVAGCQVRDCAAERRGDETNDRGFPLVIDGITLDISDDPNGGVRRAIAGEITQVYKLQDMTFSPGSIIIDIGAHVGIVSCYLAKKWPDVKIYAFEPMPANYERLERNLQANGATNVTPFSVAITADGRALTLHGDPDTNTGGYSAFTGGAVGHFARQSAKLSSFLAQHEVACIALLKLDCEGAEYEILGDIDLSCVSALVMEVHENNVTRQLFGSGASLIAAMERQIPHVRASLIRIPDKLYTEEDLDLDPSFTATTITATTLNSKEIHHHASSHLGA